MYVPFCREIFFFFDKNAEGCYDNFHKCFFINLFRFEMYSIESRKLKEILWLLYGLLIAGLNIRVKLKLIDEIDEIDPKKG